MNTVCNVEILPAVARYKPIDTSPRFLAVDLQKQLLPGTIENAVSVQANVSLTNIQRSDRS